MKGMIYILSFAFAITLFNAGVSQSQELEGKQWTRRAVAYAEHFWNGTNPEYNRLMADCANFASQIANAGCMGIAESNNIPNGDWWEESACWDFRYECPELFDCDPYWDDGTVYGNPTPVEVGRDGYEHMAIVNACGFGECLQYWEDAYLCGDCDGDNYGDDARFSRYNANQVPYVPPSYVEPGAFVVVQWRGETPGEGRWHVYFVCEVIANGDPEYPGHPGGWDNIDAIYCASHTTDHGPGNWARLDLLMWSGREDQNPWRPWKLFIYQPEATDGPRVRTMDEDH